MLLQIREFIHRERIVSTQQLMREFHLDKDALDPMLDIWMRKGVIARCDEQGSCQSSCFKCPQKSFEYYQWC